MINRFEVERIEPAAGRFRIAASDGRTVESRAVVIAGGGRILPGPRRERLVLRARRVARPRPRPARAERRAARRQGPDVPFPPRPAAAGPRRERLGGRAGQTAEGELLFTQYGLSGTAILDISESIPIALNRDGRRDVSVVVDFLPTMTAGELSGELARRLKAGWPPDDLTSGLLPEKFSLVLPQIIREAGYVPGRGDIDEVARRLAALLKAREFRVEDTRGWNEAEFTSGGVDAREVRPGTLESKLRRGLYSAGEVLDVQGGRGRFNLAWAWASGFVAGLAE